MSAKAERLANLATYLLEVDRPVPLTTIVERVSGYPEPRVGTDAVHPGP